TKSFIDKWTKTKSTIIYPYLNDDYINFDFDNILKEKIILSVGRFFPHLHSKRHDIAIKNFKKLRASNESFKDFKLVLIGGLLQEDESYFRTLQSLASHDSHIIFITNAKYSEVYSFFQKAKYYWLCAGFGVDDTKEPTFVEHLGITPLEAMAMGCITFAYNAGGPKELIQNEKTGYLFKSEQQLLRQMHEIETNTTKQKSIQTQAKIYIQQNFTYPVFKDKVIKVFNLSQ
ncbi:MAG TPA: glycosyltransferase, partial [Candidatus Nitrosocosmicus sp.]|nr:glycosyltransferase [Candidatus Nitrosocosmicus sp.]